MLGRNTRKSTVSIANPLPLALSHYTAELQAIFESAGIRYTLDRTRPTERGALGVGLARAATNALWNTVPSRTGVRLTTWPALGWADLSLRAAGPGFSWIVVHDPTPLHEGPGYGEMWRAIAGKLVARNRLGIIVHTEVAREEVQNLLGSDANIVCVPHPVLDQTSVGAQNRRVLVAGQFKPSRDIAMLEYLGKELRDQNVELVIVGRGWPEIRGWEVQSKFVSEEQLDREIDMSSLLLLPYTRYYQSGIALRALERGRPTVGFATEFLNAVMTGPLNGCAVNPARGYEGIANSITRYLGQGASAGVAYESYANRAVSEWQRWATTYGYELDLENSFGNNRIWRDEAPGEVHSE